MSLAIVFTHPVEQLEAKDASDKLLHVAISYGINHVAYVTCGVILNNPHAKLPCLISSTVLTSVVGIAKEVADGDGNSPSEHAMDLGANAAGIGLSTLAITLTW